MYLLLRTAISVKSQACYRAYQLVFATWLFGLAVQTSYAFSEVRLDDVHGLRRHKREFMFASGQNEPDPTCFQQCNDEWKRSFESRIHMNATDFYDFPFHPKLLEYGGYVKYCELAEVQTRCFIERCEDQSADRVFSPSNFLCNFKRTQFLTARPCLEDTEPLTFLKCDHFCHGQALRKTKEMQRTSLGTVFTALDRYERELDLLCSFQDCFQQCHKPIVEQSCAPVLADVAVDLIRAYVQWHASDIYDWHIVSDNADRLPLSCSRLTGYKSEDDPILRIMNNV